MPNANDIGWFKEHFQGQIEDALGGTPFDADMIISVACQETGHIWSRLRRKGGIPTEKILQLCVGDTIDASGGRSAFPLNKADLLSRPCGDEMFAIARQALVDMAAAVPGFEKVAKNASKFCHGFGVFQRDLQFFKVDPDYFLTRRYEAFGNSLEQCLDELERGVRKLDLKDREKLSDMEFAFVAIAYNTGGFKPKLGLKQGFRNSDGRFYGELIFDFLSLSRTVPGLGGAAAQPAPGASRAILPPSRQIAGDADFVVDTAIAPLRLRSEPVISDPPSRNVIAHLPDGQLVKAITGKPIKGFLEVETSLGGTRFQGFTSSKFLVPVSAPTPMPMAAVALETDSAAAMPVSRIRAVFMPAKDGLITRRTALATARSLNEDGQPARTGDTPQALVNSIGTIIDWLAVDKSTHKRYLPHNKFTFCNIYAHDFCFLAGIYLPRVWWSSKALQDLVAGKDVQPLIGNTINELRANDLFRWLHEFGPDFAWRRASTLDELQLSANQGGVGIIVARRKQDGLSGHIVIVVPESEAVLARRNAEGHVVAPIQSQAGDKNFRRRTGRLNWFRDEKFAESALWIHA